MTFAELKREEYPALCENENGEPVFIYWMTSKDGFKEYFRLDTYQNNGWIRENYYYADGLIEEIYRKE